ncbi:alpha/beta fold hydrolase [Candidatus Woesearchaeota archaeon]|nr:alpha/beta fold hydrolase [Candidatus Woesearchaeota archaeon]
MKNKILFTILLVFLTSCSFVLGNNSETGVLLTHGFEASPHELRELAQYLAARNMTVHVVRLEGHGTDIRELDKTKWQNWYNDYEKGYNELSKKTKKVFVGGHSLGGALALRLAEQKDTAGVISLASPVGLKDKRAEYAWLIKYFRKYEARNLSGEEKLYNYDRYSAAAVGQLVDFIEVYREDLPKITEPILIIQLSNDTKICPNSADYIHKSVKSRDKSMVVISSAGHSLLEEPYKKRVYEEVYNFVKKA